MNSKLITLNDFILNRQKDFPYASGELSSLLSDISLAAKIVNREVNKAGLVDILGATGNSNVQNEEVQKLDIYANNEFISALSVSGLCCGIASEENDEFISINKPGATYIVTMDPLDGSSNIDVNVSIGTIFSIYRKVSIGDSCTMEDFLQKGTEQVAAGYVLYGSSTMMVYSTGNGVNGFTLDPSIGTFCLSHPDIKIPKESKTYSVNQGNFIKFPEGVKQYIKYCQENDKPTNRPYGLRYIGSMVADLHRNLLKGGLFMYPSTEAAPKGKLRLLYECNPMAYIVEQAGGKATDGNGNRILELQPTELHQRTPVFLGADFMVKDVESFIKKYSSVEAV